MTHAPRATRGDKVTLSFGMVSIPITLFGRTVESKTQRNQFVTLTDPETGEIRDYRVGRQNVAKTDEGELVLVNGQPVVVENSQIESKYATEYGHVYVSEGEIEELLNLEPRSAKIIAFHPMSLWTRGEYVPKKPMSVEVTPVEVGKKKVPNKSALAKFSALLDAMRAMDAFAIVELVSRGIPKPAALLPDGTMWVVCAEEEIREDRAPQPEVEVPSEYTEATKMVVEFLWNDKPVPVNDTRTVLVQSYADEKAQAGDFSKPVETEVETIVVDEADDYVAQLKASLEAMKKAS